MKHFFLVVLILLNVADGGLTVYGVSIGEVIEANPIQAWWMEVLGSLWLPAKISSVTLLAVFLWHRYERNWKARVGLWATTIIYAGLLVYHLVGLFNG